jgi:predicted kinase
MGNADAQSQVAPLLVIVSGAPGSGKTILAQRLAADLAFPLVAKDDLEDVLYDTIGAPDRAASMQLGLATIRLMFHLTARLLDARTGLVLESAFRRGLSERDLRPLTCRARSVLVHCRGDPQVIARRYRERAERGERHPGHHDLLRVETVHEAIASSVYEPRQLEVPTLQVDTTAGGLTAPTAPLNSRDYTLSYARIRAFIRMAAPSLG